MIKLLKNIKIVIGSGGYNNNPGWLHTEENEVYQNFVKVGGPDPRNQGESLVFPSLIVDAVKVD